MPDGLAGASHAHGKVQKAHGCGGCGVFAKNGLIAAHAGKVIDIARFGQTDNGVDQQVGLRLACGAECQFLMRTVQRVACLKCDNLAPAHLAEIGAQFVGRIAAALEIIVNRLLDAGNRPAQIDVSGGVVQIIHRRVGAVIGTKDLFGLVRFVGCPAVGDGHDRKDHAFLIAQRNILTDLKPFGKFFRHIQVDRHRP